MRIGQPKDEPAAESELNGLLQSGLRRLDDAQRDELSLERRFDLAYNAAHALALTHRKRNLAEYEGDAASR